VDDQGARFALPHAAHRDQCAEQLPVVEAALAAHFGSEVKLVLVVDDEAAAPSSRAGAAPGEASGSGSTGDGAGHDDDTGDIDPADLADDGGDADPTSAAEARLLEAFPGASEVVT
jgi:hypothetical protein